MAELKTKVNDNDVSMFIENSVEKKEKKTDTYELLDLFRKITGYEPKILGSSIIGFGSYFYQSERSSQKGNWPLVGFSPRKSAISLYVYVDTKKNNELLSDLGEFTMGKSCIYVKKLTQINLKVLSQMIKETMSFLQEKYK
ncbi:DUF1801 domain-containing protein [Acholeplasma hippikon]|uniref:Domain of uncharacterized function (DU1801) n=1 Tax=Acholeplasma hippikon TaxID=264636 RepID=A0A449BIZ3_9MOLU|nr:DUF1801 domain-containing protein [Acholeplasma hippikon]VEU82429.1 Domain of uncharacterised function (DU1801) [Acholeplasma hippikon]